MNELAERFEAQLWDSVRFATELGYSPRIFEGMLRQYSGVQTAKRLIASGEIQYGLERLAELGRLDISMEQIMLTPEFAPLFTPGEIEAARWRLKQLG